MILSGTSKLTPSEEHESKYKISPLLKILLNWIQYIKRIKIKKDKKKVLQNCKTFI